MKKCIKIINVNLIVCELFNNVWFMIINSVKMVKFFLVWLNEYKVLVDYIDVVNVFLKDFYYVFVILM